MGVCLSACTDDYTEYQREEYRPLMAGATQQTTQVVVQVPQGISVGMMFQVNVGQQVMAIACPPGAGPGSMIQIQVPTQQPAASEAATGLLNGGLSPSLINGSASTYQALALQTGFRWSGFGGGGGGGGGASKRQEVG